MGLCVDKSNSQLKSLWGRMAIFITNMLYLAAIAPAPYVVRNRPLIGWSSFYNVDDVSSGDTAGSYSPASIWSGDTYTKWVSTPAGAPGAYPNTKYIDFNNPSDAEIDYVGIAGHNLGSAGISYSLLGYDGSAWIPITPTRTPDDNAAITEHFDPVTYGTYRLALNQPDGAPGAAIAHVKLGNILQLQRPRYVGDVPGGMDIQVEKIASKSYSGQHLGSVLVSQGNKFSITQENNTAAFCRSSSLQYFFKHARQLQKLSNGPVETFFFAWRPDDYPLEIQYCGETTSFSPPTNQRNNGMMQWSMSGNAYE